MVDQSDPIFDSTSFETGAAPSDKAKLKDGDLDRELALIALESGWGGSHASRYTASMWGLNHLGTPFPVHPNTDHYGLIFFTRPSLNLSYDNLVADRRFAQMTTSERTSMWRAIRAYLDPVGQRQNASGGDCPLVDPKNPFITLLSNLCINCSGWPDSSVEVYKSKQGNMREQWMMYDGTYKINGEFSLTANFQNALNDPITHLFSTWARYGSLVYLGQFMPRVEALIYRYIDYQCRIYRIVLDATKTRVQKIAACGAAQPVFSNEGAHFNYDSTKPVNPDVDQVSVQFSCIGAEYNDPITVIEFNRVVQMFNVDMTDENRESRMQKIPMAYYRHFNFCCYPRIEPSTMEMQWWVEKTVYNALVKGV